MTSAIESDRFEAKCASGSTYIVIEKTKELTESKILSEQTFVTSRKSYFLSTGEKLNKVREKDYLIIDAKKIITQIDPKPSKPKKFNTTDTKTIFDYLKNQALCFAIVLSIPEILIVLKNSNIGIEYMIPAISIAISMAVVFSAINCIWLFTSLEEKPKLTLVDVFVTALIISFILGASAIVTLKALQGVAAFLQT